MKDYWNEEVAPYLSKDYWAEEVAPFLEEEEELDWMQGLRLKRHIPLVEAVGDIFKPKPRKQPPPIYETLRTIEPIPAPQATTEVATLPLQIPPTIRPPTEREREEETEWKRPRFEAPLPDFAERFEKTTKNIYRGVQRALQPGDDPAMNTIKGLIRFGVGIPEFISEMGQTALETIAANTPEESARILGKKGGEMISSAAQTLQNLAWLISYSISPIKGGSREEYERRQSEFLQDPSAPVIMTWIVKGVGRSIGKIPKGKMAVKAKQIVDYVKSQDVLLKRQKGKEVPVMPTERVGITEMPEKAPVPGEAELKLARELKEKGVTEKPAEIPAELEGLVKRLPETELRAQAQEMLGETKFISPPQVTKGQRAFGVKVTYDPATTPEWYSRGVGLDKRQAISGLKAIAEEGYKTKNPYSKNLFGAIEDQVIIKRGEVPMYAGIPVPEAIREVSRLTNEMIEKMKAKPEIRAGVKEALEAMIEHDRQTRAGEFAHKKMEGAFGKAVPDKNRQLAIVHAVQQKRNPKYWDQLSLEEKRVAKWMESELDKMEAFNREHKITDIKEMPKGVRYVPGYWINPQTGKPYPLMYGRLSKGLPQAKQKVFATYEEGMKAGSEMATTNLGDIIGGAWESLIRAQQSRAMFKTLHNVAAEKGVEIQLRRGSKKKGVRMVERWDLLNKQGLTEDYVRYSHWALDKAIAFKDVNGTLVRLKGAVGVHKNLFPFVKAYMENPNYGTISRLNFASKSMKLGMSFFHVVSLGMQEAANWRIPFKNIPRGLRFRKALDPTMQILHQEGLDLFKGYEDIGYRNKFFEGQNWWGKAGNVVTKPIELMRDFIFDVVQPGMKMSFAHDQYTKLLPEYLKKGLTKEQCARDVVKAADGHFSHEHWKRSLLETNRTMVKLYFMPEARKAWQNALLSPTWQREHMLVAKDVMKSFMPDRMIKKLGMREMGPIKAEYRKYALGAAMMIGAADLYSLYATNLMDGKALHLWENPEGKKGFYVRAPWNEPSYTVTDKNGKERTIPGAPAYIRPYKSIFEVAGWFADPVEKFTYKLSPVVAAMGRQMFPSRYQKEYEGITDIPRRVSEFLLDVGTPISGSQVGLVFRGKKEPVSAVFPFFGMPTSKLKRAQTKELYYNRLAEIEKKHGVGTEWMQAKKEFEDLGYKFNNEAYLEYKRNNP